MTERLPELLDAKALQAELGVTRAAAEAIMRRLPIVQIEGLRKVYVRRSDVAAYLEARTFAKTRSTIVNRGGHRLDPLDKEPPCSPRCILRVV